MNRKKMITSVLAILTLALSSNFCAFAATNTTAGDEAKTAVSGKLNQNKVQLTDAQRTAIKNARKESKKQAAAALVKNGTMTQAEADAFLANMDKAKTKENSMFANLTDSQKESLKTESKSVYETALADLVSAGTITKTQADQLKSVQQAKLELTEAQRTAVNEARIKSINTAKANLVAKGTLTQAEANAIAIPSEKQRAQIKALRDEASAAFKNKLDALVSNGTITKNIADQVQKSPMGHGKKQGQRKMKMRKGTGPANNNSSIVTN